MARVFLSYDREDSDRVRYFAQALEKAGHDVWWDLHIKTGAQYTKEIDRALRQADAVIVLWSERSVESAWVRDEAAAARDSGRLVPVSLDHSDPPLGFRQFQTIDLSRWKGRGKPAQLQILLDDVAAMTRPKTAATAAENDPIESSSRRKHPSGLAPSLSRRSILIAAGGATILGVGAILGWKQGWFLLGDGDDYSIAVLPFKNLGGDPAQAYLSEGMTEDIRAALKRIPALRVLAATSSNLVAESGDGAVAIARKLDVAFLLEGSVQLAGKTLRIAVDLTDGRTGFSKWSDQLDRPLADIFAVQREIAETVARAMTAQIAAAKPEVGGTRNVAAYQNYLRARQTFFHSNSGKDDRAALALLDLAVAADPKFAKAHALRSRSLARMGANSASSSEARSFNEQGLQAANHAIELAPRLADAHLALSFARITRLEVKPARSAIDRAVRLAPNDADVLRSYADHIVEVGEIEAARRAATRAAALDPLNHVAHATLGKVEYATGRYQIAIGHFEKAKSLYAQGPFIRSQLSLCLMFVGDTTDAIIEAEKEPMDWMRHMALAVVRRRAGDRAGAARAFEQLTKVGPLVSYQVAEVLAQWGNIDRSIDALRRAVEIRDPGIAFARMDPLLIPLHRDSRYVAVLRQVGLV